MTKLDVYPLMQFLDFQFSLIECMMGDMDIPRALRAVSGNYVNAAIDRG